MQLWKVVDVYILWYVCCFNTTNNNNNTFAIYTVTSLNMPTCVSLYWRWLHCFGALWGIVCLVKVHTPILKWSYVAALSQTWLVQRRGRYFPTTRASDQLKLRFTFPPSVSILMNHLDSKTWAAWPHLFSEAAMLALQICSPGCC